MATCIEWLVEELTAPDTGDDVDIYDVNHYDTYAAALLHATHCKYWRIGLVRDSDRDNRSWAYIKDGRLPGIFKDAYDRKTVNVPQRFIWEFARHDT